MDSFSFFLPFSLFFFHPDPSFASFTLSFFSTFSFIISLHFFPSLFPPTLAFSISFFLLPSLPPSPCLSRSSPPAFFLSLQFLLIFIPLTFFSFLLPIFPYKFLPVFLFFQFVLYSCLLNVYFLVFSDLFYIFMLFIFKKK